MKLKNVGKRPVWIGGIEIVPGEVKEVDEEYRHDMKGLTLVEQTEEKFTGMIEVATEKKRGKKRRSTQAKDPK